MTKEQLTQRRWYLRNRKRILAKQKARYKNDPNVRIRHAENVKRYKANFKDDLIKQFGGKCSHCGYKRCPAALDFHHVRGNKKFRVSQATSKKAALEEVKKCVLLCANCHREQHYFHWN